VYSCTGVLLYRVVEIVSIAVLVYIYILLVAEMTHFCSQLVVKFYHFQSS